MGNGIWRLVLLNDRTAKSYYQDKNKVNDTWEIVDEEIHYKDGDTDPIFSINPDGSLKLISGIYNGKRIPLPKTNQPNFKKNQISVACKDSNKPREKGYWDL